MHQIKLIGVENFTKIQNENPNQCQQSRSRVVANCILESRETTATRESSNSPKQLQNRKSICPSFLDSTSYVIRLGKLICLGWDVEKGQSRLIKGLPPHFLMTTLMNFQPRSPHSRCYRACVPNTSKHNNVMPKNSTFSAS